MVSSATAPNVALALTLGRDSEMRGRELKVDQKLKKRTEEEYAAIAKAMAAGKDTTQWKKHIVRLEKRLIEVALRVTLTADELQYVKTLSTIRSVFSGAKVIEIRKKKTRYHPKQDASHRVLYWEDENGKK